MKPKEFICYNLIRQSKSLIDLRIIKNRHGQTWEGFDIQKEEEIS
jgi:hypothetical protein